MPILMTLAFGLNILVLAVIVPQLAFDGPEMTSVYGPDSPARRILTAVYVAILMASVVGLALIGFGQFSRAANLGVALFAVQITYKLITWPFVGLQNPVVVANLVICTVLVAGLIGAVAILRG